MKSWPFKDPDEKADYDIDWTWRLYNGDEYKQAKAQRSAGQTVTVVPADQISASTFTLPLGVSLVATDPSNDGTHTKVWLTGGDEGATYIIVNEIVTVAGRRFDQSVKLKVKTK